MVDFEDLLSAEATASLLEELLQEYDGAAFRHAADELVARWDAGIDQAQRCADRDELCMQLVQRHVLPKYGLTADQDGVQQAETAVAYWCKSYKELRRQRVRIGRTFVELFPSCFGSGSAEASDSGVVRTASAPEPEPVATCTFTIAVSEAYVHKRPSYVSDRLACKPCGS
eukprot:3348902-Amphidinium_carterae.1